MDILAGDDTDSHIDTLARFISEDTICYVECRDEEDEHYQELNRMRGQLESFRMRDGGSYRLIPLPMPSQNGILRVVRGYLPHMQIF